MPRSQNTVPNTDGVYTLYGKIIKLNLDDPNNEYTANIVVEAPGAETTAGGDKHVTIIGIPINVTSAAVSGIGHHDILSPLEYSDDIPGNVL